MLNELRNINLFFYRPMSNASLHLLSKKKKSIFNTVILVFSYKTPPNIYKSVKLLIYVSRFIYTKTEIINKQICRKLNKHVHKKLSVTSDTIPLSLIHI